MIHKSSPFCRTAGILVLGCTLSVAAGSAPAMAQATAGDYPKVRTEIPYGEGKVILLSDFQEKISRTRYRARGRVEIRYQEALITAEEIQFDEVTRRGFTAGETRFSQDNQWLTCSRADFDFSNQTGTFYDATGFVDEEFLIRGQTVYKTGRDTYRIEDGFVTACNEANPKWSFGMSSANIRVDNTARLRNVVFKIKGLPVFYAPYLIVPMERKSRSSGLLPFHVGNSNTKGFVFSLGYFQTLGTSADIVLYGDYFSDRGVGLGGVFRARPSERSRLHIEAWGIDDKLGQGGAHLLVDGESRFDNGFRAVASVNITTNFSFRQAFMGSFRTATIPEERSNFFLTRNQGSLSTNIVFQRDEILFPIRSLVVRKSPSIEFFSLGKPMGPLLFSLRASAEGISRIGQDYETPKLVQRLDFFPSATLRLPSYGGFSLRPTIAVRGTYYSARLSGTQEPEVVPKSLRRQIVDFKMNLRTPSIEKSFQSSRFGDFKHVVEPVISYRRTHGVKHLEETIRFDEQDAIADTNEIEYGIVNRFYRKRASGSGVSQNHEFLAFKIAQKYYFDPTFGGAFHPGVLNIFYPLNTLTGFAATGMERRFSPISMSARLSPTPGISHDVRLDYDTKLHRLRNASISSYWQQDKVFIAGTYFKANALELGMLESHHIQGQVGYGAVSQGISASISLSYNIRNSSLLNTHTRVHYAWDCCGVALEYQHFDLGLRTERRFNFSFTLKGIGSFGSLKRAESLF